jgi:hypothetical protein
MAITYTVVWTPTGGAATTLFDITVARQVIELQNPGNAEAVEQVDDLAFASAASRLMRGNVKGEVEFSVATSYADVATAAADFKAKRALVNGMGSLVITIGATTLTYANATLRSLRPRKTEGVRWTLGFSFGVTTVT